MVHVLSKGQLIGCLTSPIDQKAESVKSNVLLKCVCGKEMEVRLSNAKSGNTRSCGCLKLNHGCAGTEKTPEYFSWQSMKQRCSNSNAASYHRYGGRGISVCERWISSFECFLQDMGSRPEGFSLERIDVNKGYSPSNCKWASPKEQARNRCDNRVINAFGREMIFSDAAIEFNLSKGCLAARLTKMSTEEALTMPLAKRRPRK